MNKTLKIAILVDQLVPGGVQKSAIQEAKELIKLGYHVTLFVLIRLKSNYQYEDLSKNIQIIFLSDYNPVLFRKPLRIPYFSFLTNLHIINPFFSSRYKILIKYNLIISHGTTTCITAKTISQKFNIPYVAFIWDPMLFILEKVYSQTPIKHLFPFIKPLINYYEKSFLEAALLVATSSKVHKKYLQDKYQIDPIIIKPGCVSPRLQNIPFKNKKYILGYTRWELAKNPMLFLWLAKKLPTIKFLIAGTWTNSEEQKYFKNQIIHKHLQKKVFLKSPITNQNINEISNKSFVWVHPNFEAFGMSGLEMASYGLPIIIPQNSGLTEIFKSGIHGYFPITNSKYEYLKYLKILINNPQKTKQMGLLARKVAQKITWKKHTQTFISTIIPLLNKPTLKILETCQVLGTNLSGGDKLMEPMAQKLNKQFNFSIITSIFGYEHWQKTLFLKKISILPKNIFDKQASPVPVFLTYCLRMWSTTINMLKNQNDYTYSSTNILPDILPAYIAKKFKPQTIWIARVHHLIPPPFKREGNIIVNTVSFLMQILSLKLIKSTANKILILNEPLKKNLIQRNFPIDKLFVLGAGIDIKKISNSSIHTNNKFTGVFLGRLHITKGIYDLVPIWQQVVTAIPKAKLAIIGSGPDSVKQQLLNQIKKHKLTKSIYILGFLTDDQVINIMRNAKIFLFTDHEAGWSLAAAEAMSCGLPVVGFDLGILGSVFKKGFIKIPSYDIDLFQKNVIRILSNKKQLQILSNKALQESKRHSWSKVIRKFQQILNK